MHIEFLDDTTVVITEKLQWENKRPDNPKVMRKELIVDVFVASNPDYIIKSVSGPSKICNFRDEKSSSGKWTLKVKKKTAAKKVVPKKVVPKKKEV